MKVLGIDIEPGSSPNSSIQPTYAIVLIDEKGNILEKIEHATISKIIRVSWEYKPDLLALDNVYELGDARKIIKIVQLLPQNIDIVQVTYINGEFKDIKELAKENGIDIQHKLSPMRTAYIAALLALRGVGTKLKLVESKTKIIVSRGRQANAGGMSQNRFKRHIRGLVLRVSKQIREILNKHGFDYDLIIKRSKAGIENATFIVYAPRESLYGLIHKINTHNLKVEIRPVYKMKITFSEEKRNNRPILVGLDPGPHVGISIIDLYGNPVYFESKKSVDREEIVSTILQYGKPILISTDVNPLPESVKKIASKLGAKIFVPEKSLSVDEKSKIVSEYISKYGISIEDAHVRDSLASVLKVYKDIEKKFNEARSLVRKIDIDVDEEEVLSCIAKGNTVADCVELEIGNLLDKELARIEHNSSKEDLLGKKNENKNIQFKPEDMLYLKSEIENLKRKLKDIIVEKEELERKYEELKVLYKKEVEIDRRVYELTLKLNEKNKIIQQYLDKINILNSEILRLKEVIKRIISNDVVIITKDKNSYNLIISLRDDGIETLGEKISNDMVLYFEPGLAVLEKSFVNDLQKLYMERIEEESKKLDLHKIISEYRLNRSKQRDFTF